MSACTDGDWHLTRGGRPASPPPGPAGKVHGRGRAARAVHCGAWDVAARETGGLLPAPVLTLDQIRVGPHPRDPHFPREETETVGTSFVWGDRWAFDRATRALRSLIWRIPESNMRSCPPLPAARPARLLLATVRGRPEEPAARHFTAERLVAARAATLLDARRFLLAPDLSVVVDGGRWWGWVLERPLAHLADGPGSAALGPLIEQWYAAACEDTLDALDDADAALGRELRALISRTTAVGGPAALALADQIASVRETFYGQ